MSDLIEFPLEKLSHMLQGGELYNAFHNHSDSGNADMQIEAFPTLDVTTSKPFIESGMKLLNIDTAFDWIIYRAEIENTDPSKLPYIQVIAKKIINGDVMLKFAPYNKISSNTAQQTPFQQHKVIEYIDKNANKMIVVTGWDGIQEENITWTWNNDSKFAEYLNWDDQNNPVIENQKYKRWFNGFQLDNLSSGLLGQGEQSIVWRTITRVDIIVAEPEHGTNYTFTPLVNPDHNNIGFDIINTTWLPTGLINRSRDYNFSVTLKAQTDPNAENIAYLFSGTEWSINGITPISVVRNSVDTYTLYGRFVANKTLINEIKSITLNTIAPYMNRITVISIDPTEDYTVSNLEWIDYDPNPYIYNYNSVPDFWKNRYDEGSNKLSITLTAKSGLVFSSSISSSALNWRKRPFAPISSEPMTMLQFESNEVAYANVEISQDGTTATLTYDFNVWYKMPWESALEGGVNDNSLHDSVVSRFYFQNPNAIDSTTSVPLRIGDPMSVAQNANQRTSLGWINTDYGYNVPSNFYYNMQVSDMTNYQANINGYIAAGQSYLETGITLPRGWRIDPNNDQSIASFSVRDITNYPIEDAYALFGQYGLDSNIVRFYNSANDWQGNAVPGKQLVLRYVVSALPLIANVTMIDEKDPTTAILSRNPWGINEVATIAGSDISGNAASSSSYTAQFIVTLKYPGAQLPPVNSSLTVNGQNIGGTSLAGNNAARVQGIVYVQPVRYVSIANIASTNNSFWIGQVNAATGNTTFAPFNMSVTTSSPNARNDRSLGSFDRTGTYFAHAVRQDGMGVGSVNIADYYANTVNPIPATMTPYTYPRNSIQISNFAAYFPTGNTGMVLTDMPMKTAVVPQNNNNVIVLNYSGQGAVTQSNTSDRNRASYAMTSRNVPNGTNAASTLNPVSFIASTTVLRDCMPHWCESINSLLVLMPNGTQICQRTPVFLYNPTAANTNMRMTNFVNVPDNYPVNGWDYVLTNAMFAIINPGNNQPPFYNSFGLIHHAFVGSAWYYFIATSNQSNNPDGSLNLTYFQWLKIPRVPTMNANAKLFLASMYGGYIFLIYTRNQTTDYAYGDSFDMVRISMDGSEVKLFNAIPGSNTTRVRLDSSFQTTRLANGNFAHTISALHNATQTGIIKFQSNDDGVTASTLEGANASSPMTPIQGSY